MKSTVCRKLKKAAMVTTALLWVVPAINVWGAGMVVHEDINTDGPLVSMGPDGKLVYKPYTNRGDTIPDWSNCGYKSNAEPIPDVPAVLTLKPLPGEARKQGKMAYAFGPDSSEPIQKALDDVASRKPDANGLRGAVLLSKGAYYVAKTLRVPGGVVLRGEGDGEDGTVLIYGPAGTGIVVGGTKEAGTGTPADGGKPAGASSAITDDDVPTGSMKVTVEDASKFKPGDFVDVQKTPNQAWIDALGMGSITSKRGDRKGKPWKPQQYKCAHLRHVVAVNGNTLTLNAPLTQTLAKGHGGGVVFLRDDKTREVNCGVESLRIVSNYDTTIVNDVKAGEPYPADEKNTLQTGVLITNCIDGWVRNVTVQHANFSAVQCGRNSYRTTVRDCKCLAMVSVIRGGKRYPFSNSDAVMSLFFNCFAETGRHDFAGGSRDTGPNAYVMCRACKSNLVTGPHQRWGTGYLFDNVVIEGNRQSGLEAINRGAGGSGQGWAGATTVFWNCTANSAHVMDPPTPEQNFVIGFTGGQTSGDGHVESPDKHVQPQSLFLRQLKERLGDKVVAMYPIPAKR